MSKVKKFSRKNVIEVYVTPAYWNVKQAPEEWELTFFFFFIWVLRPFQEYFTYIQLIIHQRWAKTREPVEKQPDRV